MKFTPTEIPEVIVVEPNVYKDERGFFLETFQAERYAAGGIPGPFVQDNHSKSSQNVLRGLHAQRLRPQGKLLRVVQGSIFDVAVDIRKSSPTFGKWVGVELTEDNFKQIYVPPGFVHGFAVLSPVAQVEYKCTDFYKKDDEITVLWNDPEIGVQWPLGDPILSEKDRNAQPLSQQMEILPE